MQSVEGLLSPPESSSALPLSVPLAPISYVHFSSKLFTRWMVVVRLRREDGSLSKMDISVEHLLLSFMDFKFVAE